MAIAYDNAMKSAGDVLVVGGGVIGLTTAYFLARDGVRVTVLDAGELGRESSWAGAGIINPGNLDKATTPITRLLGLSTALHPTLAGELRERTGIDTGYRRCGGIELQSGIDETTLRLWRAEGIRHELIEASDWGQVEPALELLPEPGYYLPDMAQLRNPRHLKALIAACGQLGVACLPNRAVREFKRDGSRIVAAVTDQGEWQAERFLVAAGAWTRRLLEPLGAKGNVFPVRGQIVLFNPGRVVFRTIVSRGKHYLVPRDDGRILAGSTEEDAGFTKATTPEATAKLTTLAHELVPALRDAPIEVAWSGLRPGTGDELPYLGRVPETDNLFLAAGHFRAGLMLSPGTAQVMSQLIRGQCPTIPLDAFSLERG